MNRILELVKKYPALSIVLGFQLFRFILLPFMGLMPQDAYYHFYGENFSWCYFDHPGMIGYLLRIFTLTFGKTVFVVKLTDFVITSLTLLSFYKLAECFLSREKLNRAMILIASTFFISILSFNSTPDVPLLLFWTLSVLFLYRAIFENKKASWIYAGLAMGLAFDSKYTALLLPIGLILFLLFSPNYRKLLISPWLIFSLCIAVFMIYPVWYWNYSNDFISYKFHGNRVSFFSLQFNKNSFIREILGQFIYNNPYIVITLVLLLIVIWKKKFHFSKNYIVFFCYCSFPLILTTIYLSISRNTLPHWSGVSYLTLLPLIAAFLSERKKNITKNLSIGIVVVSVLMITTTFVINNGLFLPEENSVQMEKLGRKDALLDMYGWEQASEKLTQVFKEEYVSDLPIISNRWYPAAHIDYYIARPNNMKVYGVGNLNEIHKYYWINQTYSELGDEVLYITDSRNFKNPKTLFENSYSKFNLLRTVPIERSGVVVKYVFLYKLSKV
jgi:predicted membrane-bound mannosyltransferase